MSSFISSGCVYKQSSYKNLVKIYIDLIGSTANVEIENVVCYSPESDLSSTKSLEEVEKDNSFSKVTHINCKQIRDDLEFVVRFYEEHNYQGVLFDLSYDYLPEMFSAKSLENKLISILITIYSYYPYYFSFIDTEAEVDMFHNPGNIEPLESPYATLILPKNDDFHVYLNTWEIDGISERKKKHYVIKNTPSHRTN
ncbi:hypothetical protein IOO79_001262 [Listeria monocytogenes]|nr:hypothetical protein [Listeria monocytogenes]ECB9704893.1 hypothetical protein [Listeria monocytogenes]ECB9829384.1 hypothetical protein [Listeria monocytogenes]ECJ9748275.1 hypothetical protein [Listeria monocytogenes]EGK1783734.1 hypothetical protein [Listeria monocytogenes]